MLIGQEITVLGAGIAGLAVATALAQRGAQVHVLERAARVEEVGAGLQISPNGARVLKALGISPPGDPSEAVELLDGLTDRTLLRMALPQETGFYLCHRADLVSALEASARSAGVRITCGVEVAEVSISDAGCTLHKADGSEETARRLIGADGLHAPTRTAVLGQTPPFFTGNVAWRAIATGVSHPTLARVHTLPRAHVVTYPLRGGQGVNIVAVEEREAWVEEGWHHRADPAELRTTFGGVSPALTEVLEGIEQCHIWGLFRHPVAPQWSKGPCVLLGDAAHPTLPFLAQGANLALEDAWTLAACLAQADWDEACTLYQAKRLPRVTRAIEAANANARNYHLTGVKRYLAHKALRGLNMLAPQRMLGRFDWLYGHDVTALD